jgi:hypothetical protein
MVRAGPASSCGKFTASHISTSTCLLHWCGLTPVDSVAQTALACQGLAPGCPLPDPLSSLRGRLPWWPVPIVITPGLGIVQAAGTAQPNSIPSSPACLRSQPSFTWADCVPTFHSSSCQWGRLAAEGNITSLRGSCPNRPTCVDGRSLSGQASQWPGIQPHAGCLPASWGSFTYHCVFGRLLRSQTPPEGIFGSEDLWHLRLWTFKKAQDTACCLGVGCRDKCHLSTMASHGAAQVELGDGTYLEAATSISQQLPRSPAL